MSIAPRATRVLSLPGVCLLLAVLAGSAPAATYEVGPGKTYTTLRAAPWTTLQPGDVVNVYPQAGPYYEKLSLSRSGTAGAPITIHGVADAQGNRPILDGTNAIQNSDSVYNNDRGLIITGNGGDTTGQYWVIENLELRNATAGGTFYRGTTAYTYNSNAAGVFLQGGKSAVVRNCWIHDNMNGVQTGSKSQNVTNVLIEACRVENNGAVGSQYQHNFYNGAEPLTVQYCYIGGLKAGADGQNFKDRGSGTVFRYNWIEGGPNDQFDLVEGGTRPADAYVYGNVIVKNNQSGNGRLVLFGFDGGGGGGGRAGTLYFVNNTVITTRSFTYLFQVTSGNAVQAHNNIVYYPGGGVFPQILTDAGSVTGSYNWISPGYSLGGATLTSTISPASNNPCFANYATQDYHLVAGSAGIDAGALGWTGQASTTATRQYVVERQSEARPADSHIDIGAYEYVAPPPPHVTGFTPALGAVSYLAAPLTQMTIAFDKDVTITAGMVTVTGANTGPKNAFTFAYSSVTCTATLQWPAGLPNDTYTLTVSDAVTSGGVALDGEVGPAAPTLPSGNGTAGGACVVSIRRMAGDINQDRSVNALDLLVLAASWGKSTGTPGFDALSDLNADGSINVLDLLILSDNWAASIP